MALSDHGKYSGVVDIARNGIDEVIRLKTQAKQDDALIQQLVEALESVSGGEVCAVSHHAKKDRHEYGAPCPVSARHDAAINAARARLEK